MDKKNIIILGFAIVAIGLFVIPSTMSMFVGQHQWYSVRTVDEQYEMCQRCHAAEVGEWKANTGAHYAYALDNQNVGCFCHQINSSEMESFGFNKTKVEYGFEIFNESGLVDISNPDSYIDEWRTTETPHAAITIECIDCHYNATAQLSNNNSAHKQFQDQASNRTLNPGGSNNTACMACHTMVGLNITIERVWSGINITANHTIDAGGNYTWDVNVSINNTLRTENSTWMAPNETFNVSAT